MQVCFSYSQKKTIHQSSSSSWDSFHLPNSWSSSKMEALFSLTVWIIGSVVKLAYFFTLKQEPESSIAFACAPMSVDPTQLTYWQISTLFTVSRQLWIDLSTYSCILEIYWSMCAHLLDLGISSSFGQLSTCFP